MGRRACGVLAGWCNLLGWVVVYGLMMGVGGGRFKRVVAWRGRGLTRRRFAIEYVFGGRVAGATTVVISAEKIGPRQGQECQKGLSWLALRSRSGSRIER